MDEIAIALPLRKNKRDALREYIRKLDERAEEEQAFHEKYGIKREVLWLQATPYGDQVIMYREVNNSRRAGQAMEEIMTSQEPFLTWVREHIMDIYDVPPSQEPPPAPEKIADRTF